MRHPIHWIALAGFALVPAFSARVSPNDYRGGFSRDRADTEARNSNSIAMILGEFRSNMSDLVFIKTERYLHAGVGYAPHIDMSRLASTGEVVAKGATKGGAEEVAPDDHEGHDHAHDDDAHDEAHDHGHEDEAHDHEDHEGHDHSHDAHEGHDHAHGDEGPGLITIIPTKQEDFRGFVGWLERNVKPWRDPSEPDVHGTGDEILPWYRVMTFADPHNVRGYLIGAWWLKAIRGGEKAGEAMAFLEEGIRNNPEAFQLHLMKGFLLQRQFDDLAAARPVFRRAAELALKARPDDPPPDSLEWTHYDEDDASAAFRMAVLSEKEVGNHAVALQLARRFLAKLKTDGSLERQIKILEAELSPAPAPVPASTPADAGPPAPATNAPAASESPEPDAPTPESHATDSP